MADLDQKIEDAGVQPAPEAAVHETAPVVPGAKSRLDFSRGSSDKRTNNSAVETLKTEIQSRNRDDTILHLKTLCANESKTYFEIGCCLVRIKAGKWHKPIKSFLVYVHQEFYLEPRRAQYYMRIYENMTAAKVDWSQFQHLGWPKMRLIAPVVTQETAVGWIEFASKHTFIEIEKRAKTMAAHSKTGAGPQLQPTKNKQFKFLPNEFNSLEAAIAKAKSEKGAATDSAALAIICDGFVGKQTADEMLSELGSDALGELLTTVLSKHDRATGLDVLQKVVASLQAVNEPAGVFE